MFNLILVGLNTVIWFIIFIFAFQNIWYWKNLNKSDLADYYDNMEQTSIVAKMSYPVYKKDMLSLWEVNFSKNKLGTPVKYDSLKKTLLNEKESKTNKK